MKTENDVLVQKIIPILQKIGWDVKNDLHTEVNCSVGRIDLLCTYNGIRLAIIEVKKPKKGKKTSLTQAIKYAKAYDTPIAIATDGSTYFNTYNIKFNQELRDFDNYKLSNVSDLDLLTKDNLIILKNKCTLSSKIKSQEELRGVFNKLNTKGKDLGLTSGIERVNEIAKIIFIKMLADNMVIFEEKDWENIRASGINQKVRAINDKLRRLKEEEKFLVSELSINDGKNDVVHEIVSLLDTIDFNHSLYDINGSLFEEFLSERARGGTTNDLGQYFTPKKIISLIYYLCNYQKGQIIYDPFCGTGGILNEFFIQNNTSKTPIDQKREFGKKYLFGTELGHTIASLARMNMILIGDGHSNIIVEDSLSKNNKYVNEDKTFDIIATNIPFVPKTPTNIKEGYFTLSNKSSDKSKFIEHCINRCKVGGRVVLIVGKGFLTNKEDRDFRKNLLEKYSLEAVYTLYEGVFSPYTQVFSCVLVIDKKEPLQNQVIKFFSIQDENDIEAVKDNIANDKYYQIKKESILQNDNIDLRGKIYKQQVFDGTIKVKDLVNYIKPQDTIIKEYNNMLKKLTTPNSIQEGIRLISTQSNKQVKEGQGSFICELKKGAIIIARITNKRSVDGRYIGSAMVGDDVGHLITKEYYQIVPKNNEDLFFLLHFFRSKKFQEIIELASGTGGQQRIDIDFILNEPIKKPTIILREGTKKILLEIEGLLKNITQQQKKVIELKKEIINCK